MDKIPNYACVNEAVGLARKKTNHNLSALVNGVLRNIIRNLDNITYPPADTIDFLAVYHSHPEWLVEKLSEDYGRVSCEEILLYNNQRPKLQLRTNTLKTNRAALLDELSAAGVEGEPSKLSPEAININKLGVALDKTTAYQKGHFYIQNAASMLAASILNPQPGEMVYDLCSGVGGKATHLAQLMNNQGHIHCYDIYQPKLTLLEKNAARLGIDIITPHLKDVLQITTEPVADKVLLDAPCSGLGVLNRRADLRWNKTLADLQTLNNLQKQLLGQASRIVKIGGYILYATCTINKAENEEVIFNFMANTNEFELIAIDEQMAYFPLTAEDQPLVARGTLTIIPGQYQTDGMFYALLRRKGAN